MTATEAVAHFRRAFPDAAGRVCVARAPGRVNLIGEHTDYNGGFVLPMALDRAIAVAFQPTPPGGERVELYAAAFDQRAAFALDDLSPREEAPWLNYPMGVAWALRQAGHRLRGFRGVVAGDVPIGAGLSSSAAFEVASALAFAHVGGLRIEPLDLARLCQRAENDFVGMRCGIMDQYVSLFARAGSALLIDCRSLEHRAVPLPDSGYVFLVCDTGVKHELVATEYNVRRRECEEAIERLRAADPAVRDFRDVDPAHLERHAGALGPTRLKRARHVVTENRRVLDAVAALEAGEVEGFGGLLVASHESLRDDFEVSCRELDVLVDLACAEEGVLGSRMTGGGFGGCTVSLVRAERVEAVRRAVAEGYRRATGHAATCYVFHAAPGAAVEESDG